MVYLSIKDESIPAAVFSDMSTYLITRNSCLKFFGRLSTVKNCSVNFRWVRLKCNAYDGIVLKKFNFKRSGERLNRISEKENDIKRYSRRSGNTKKKSAKRFNICSICDRRRLKAIDSRKRIIKNRRVFIKEKMKYER